MREYQIQINITVDARDEEEAIEIAGALRRACEYGTPWRTRDVEVNKLEEM